MFVCCTVQGFMTGLRSSVTIDLLDAIQFLDVLYVSQSHVMLRFNIHRAIVAVACLNMFLPTILLFALSRTRYGRSAIWMKRLHVMHRVVYFLVVNVPMLVLRSVIWHVHKKDVSVFIVKNYIGVGVVINEVYSNLVVFSTRPAQRADLTPGNIDIEMENLKPAAAESASIQNTALTPASTGTGGQAGDLLVT